MNASGFNLSALAVRERAVTLFLLLAVTAAGIFAFQKLGRAEDPAFTVKTMSVSAAWPGATTSEIQRQVADPLEKRLQELVYYDRVETTVRPGLMLMKVYFRSATSNCISDNTNSIEGMASGGTIFILALSKIKSKTA